MAGAPPETRREEDRQRHLNKIRILLRWRTGKGRKQVTDWHLNGGSYSFLPRNKSWFGEVNYMS